MTFRERVGFGAVGEAGFVLGTANNIFGATSGDTDLSTITIAANRAAAEATRDAYDTATAGWLANYTDIDVNIILYYTAAGEPTAQYQRRIGTNWVDNGPPIVAITGPQGAQGPAGQGVNFANTAANTFIRTNTANDALVNASLEEEDLQVTSTKMLEVPDAEGVMFGAVQVASAAFNITAVTADGSVFYPLVSQLQAGGSVRPGWIKAAGLTTTPSPSNTSETFTGANVQFRIINQNTGFAQRYTLNAAAVATDCNFIIRLGSHTGEAIFDYKRATGGTGFDLAVGVNQVNLPLIRQNPDVRLNLFFRAGIELYVTIEPGSGNISLLGQTIDVGGVNETVPFIETFGRTSEDIALLTNDAGEITALTEKTAPVSADNILIEDSEDSNSKKRLQIANLPTGGGGIQGITVQDEGAPLTALGTTLNFAGAGVTATGTGATKTITIPGGTGGISGVTVQDEGVALTTAATILNFLGTGVTAAGTTETKTITIPGLTIEDEGGALTAVATTLNFTGAGVTATGTGATKTINIPGVPSGTAVTSLHNFSIGIPARVDIGTNLNVQQTISFDVSNYSNLTALELIVTDGDNIALTLPIRDGVQSQIVTLTGTNTGAATTITFQLSGTVPTGTVTSNIQTVTVANALAQEQAYYGDLVTNAFATVDVATLTGADVTNPGSVYEITETVPNGNFFGILSPNNRDPVSVLNTVLNIDELSGFTATTNVRTIGGLSYNLLVVQNNSGFQSVFRYRVTTE